MNELGVETLRERLDYDPDTGNFVWKERPLSTFSCKRVGRGWNNKYANKAAGFTRNDGYLRITLQGKVKYLHRIAWAMQYGEWPEGQIDHIDGNPSNNSIKNLRDVTPQENNRNRAIDRRNKSGVIGVFWCDRTAKWRGQLTVNRNPIHLGYFTNKQDAIAARKAAEIEYGYHENHGRDL